MKVTLYMLWKNAMTVGLLERPRELEYLEPSLEIMSLIFNQKLENCYSNLKTENLYIVVEDIHFMDTKSEVIYCM